MGTFQQVYNDLDRLERNIISQMEEIPKMLKKGLVDEVEHYPSIKTRAYVNAIDYQSVTIGANQGWELDGFTKNNDVHYDGYLEFETFNRGRKSTRVARLHNKKAIEGANFQEVFDDMLDSSLSNSVRI